MPSTRAKVSISGTLDPIERTATAIRKARTSVQAVVYKFDRRLILRAFKTALKRGVIVRLLVDSWQIKGRMAKGSNVKAAAKLGAQVRVWEHGKLHAKFAILDGNFVLSGSYNWTKSAAKRNTELLLMFDGRKTVRQFDKLFKRLWTEGTPL